MGVPALREPGAEAVQYPLEEQDHGEAGHQHHRDEKEDRQQERRAAGVEIADERIGQQAAGDDYAPAPPLLRVITPLLLRLELLRPDWREEVKILERRQLAAAADPEALQAKLEASYRERFLSPWPAAHAGFVDEVIVPAETRERLVAALAASP